jgi:hypothetical protein
VIGSSTTNLLYDAADPASTRRAWAGSCRRTPLALGTTSTCMPMWATTRQTGTDASRLIAREAMELAAGLGSAISSGWSASVAAFQNESPAGIALKSVEGLNPTVGAAVGAGVKLAGTVSAPTQSLMIGLPVAACG